MCSFYFLILHHYMGLTFQGGTTPPIFRFSWHLGGTTPPDIAFFPDPGGILSAEKRKNANYNCQKYSQIPIQLRKCPPDFLRKSFSGGAAPPESDILFDLGGTAGETSIRCST